MPVEAVIAQYSQLGPSEAREGMRSSVLSSKLELTLKGLGLAAVTFH